jgi:DNA repair protein RadC
VKSTAIKDWPVDDRPREKLLYKGTDHLSNSELIAILINNGAHKKSAVMLAQELLTSMNNDLNKLSRLSVKDILNLNIKGLGPAKAVSISAAIELGLRRDASYSKRKTISSSRDAADYVRLELQFKKQELFGVIFLNQGNRITHFQIVSEGGITSTVADPRIILKTALAHDAVHIILCHNHPSGCLKPSRADISLTQKIKAAALTLEIQVIDHIIVSEEGYYSFADHDLL